MAQLFPISSLHASRPPGTAHGSSLLSTLKPTPKDEPHSGKSRRVSGVHLTLLEHRSICRGPTHYPALGDKTQGWAQKTRGGKAGPGKDGAEIRTPRWGCQCPTPQCHPTVTEHWLPRTLGPGLCPIPCPTVSATGPWLTDAWAVSVTHTCPCSARGTDDLALPSRAPESWL